MASGRRMAGAIRSLVNARDLQVECAIVLHETLLVPVLTHGSKMKGLMRMFFDGLAMWRGWRREGLLREPMWENGLVVVQWLGRGRDGLP